MRNISTFIKQVRSLTFSFWMFSLMQAVERLAFWCALVQMPIYIAQKDAPGGLHWDQAIKGMIFLVWALVQNLVPVASGGFADKYGHRKVLGISFFIIVVGYILIGTQRDVLAFLASALVLGIGIGIFRPAVLGSVALNLNPENSSVGWGIFNMLVNAAILFAGPVIVGYLKSISWQVLFLGCGGIMLLNYLLLLFAGKSKPNPNLADKPGEIFIYTFKRLVRSRLLPFILFMSGFTIIYLQFYETLPNFLYDWVDTSTVARALSLPESMISHTPLGSNISIEWLYAFSSGLIVIGVSFVSWLVSGFRRTTVIIAGMGLVASGIILSGATMYGWIAVGGIVIYTFGEMITNPKFSEYVGSIAPEGEKALFMSYMSISWAIGLGSGSLIGGWLYRLLGEKSGMAINYLTGRYGMIDGLNSGNAFMILTQKTGLGPIEATSLLWNTYHPWLLWLPFLALGLICAGGIYFYSKRIRNYDNSIR